MAPLKFAKVVGFSSEDSQFPASNLLVRGKWRCKEEGEKHAWVCLQLEELSVITNIDIGNFGAAFVTVQVGRRGGDPEQMKELLVASSFMSPTEARVGDNAARVRMFGPDSLAAGVAAEKWDLVKIVATQPFTKHSKYGVSFVALSGPDKPKPVSKLGAFKLKDDSDSDIAVGSYFARKKDNLDTSASKSSELKETKTGPTTIAAAIRAESSLAEMTIARAKKEDKKRKIELTPAAREEAKKRRVDREFPSRLSLPGEFDEHTPSKPKPQLKDTTPKVSKLIVDKISSTPSRDGKPKDSKNTIENKKASKKAEKSNKIGKFNEFLKGVHFAISGFQNPLRGEIRQKALDMGAKYHGDWNSSCTHLVCAFTNTPKFNQVKGKGKIVKKEWIEECHSQRKRLPWRRFCLDKADKNQDESEDEVWEDKQNNNVDYDCDTDEEIERIKEEEKRESKMKDDLKIPEISAGGSTSKVEAYDCDTDDEIEECRNEMNGKENTTDPYDVETDIDEEECDRLLPNTSKMKMEKLPTFMSGLTFLLHNQLSSKEKSLLERYIIACGGEVENYMSSNVDFVIANSRDERMFSQASNVKSDVKFVLPAWIFSCQDESKLVNNDSFLLK